MIHPALREAWEFYDRRISAEGVSPDVVRLAQLCFLAGVHAAAEGLEGCISAKSDRPLATVVHEACQDFKAEATNFLARTGN